MERPEPYIIKGENEAREHYRQLRACGFEIRLRGKVLTAEELAGVAKVKGKVDLLPIGATQQDNDEGFGLTVEIDPSEAALVMAEAKEMGYAVLEPSQVLDEAGFILVAVGGGKVDLRRVRWNNTIGRYFGSSIGWSMTPSIKVTVSPGDVPYIQ